MENQIRPGGHAPALKWWQIIRYWFRLLVLRHPRTVAARRVHMLMERDLASLDGVGYSQETAEAIEDFRQNWAAGDDEQEGGN